MKKLGLIGGMGPESTIPYYHDIVYGVQKAQKEAGEETHFTSLTIESVDVFTVLGLCAQKKYDELYTYLMRAIEAVVAAGADFAALSANTPHIIYDRLEAASPIPLISIVESTKEETMRRGMHRIGLLGTKFTMNEKFFKEPFEKAGISIIVPQGEEQELVHEKISSELELGIVKPETLVIFQKLIEKMKKENEIEAVVLGCTELPLLLNDDVTCVPCLDTMQIHIEDLVAHILEIKR